MQENLHIGMVAGEASGDSLGASLISRLRDQFPELRVSGVGGEAMIAEGMESLYKMDRLSIMGFVEPLKRLPELFKMRRRLIRHFVRSGVDIFIGIDSPEFNLGVARRLHGSGIKTVQYVSPSVWAWRQGRVKGIRKSIDLMMTLFPFEAQFYEREGVPVKFVGHPLASEIEAPLDRTNARSALGLDGHARVVTLMPGSRQGEVEMLWPIFLETLARLRASSPELVFVVPAANTALYDRIEAMTNLDINLLRGRAREAIAASDVVLLASGTSTLEVMLLNRPMVVAYRLGRVTYQILLRLVHSPFFAIPNLLAGREVVPEYIQDEANPRVLSEMVLKLIDDPETAALQTQAFVPLRQQLNKDSASQAAGAVIELLKK